MEFDFIFHATSQLLLLFFFFYYEFFLFLLLNGHTSLHTKTFYGKTKQNKLRSAYFFTQCHPAIEPIGIEYVAALYK